MVVPPPLIEPMVARRHLTDGSTATVLQATFAAFLDGGDLDRHLRHTRRVYRERRDAVLAALGRWMPDATPMGVSAGQNVLVMLPAGADEGAVVRRALDVGVRVYPLAGFLWTADENRRTRRVNSDPPSAGVGEAAGRGRPALILGYGSVAPDRALHGIRQLSRCIADR
jgi:GntR family transcriptional regulator/MocR family aminotransferase